MTGPCLLVDLGGTNVRLATLRADGQVDAQESWLTALYPDFTAVVEAYRPIAGVAGRFAAALVCAAGPPSDGRVVLTNCSWEISEREIAAATGAPHVVLVNDFAAVARALPVLGADDLVQVGGEAPVAGATKAALGPGTGLGVASAVGDGLGGWAIASGEGGHVDLAPCSARELAVVYQLMREHGHVSAERVLSGPGLETLYLAIAALDGLSMKSRPMAPDIVRAAHQGSDAAAVETVELFTAWLGSVAGNLALTVGALGGVYIAGGIVGQWGARFDAKLFRHRFEAKGRMRHYLAPIPCYLVTARDPAFRGLAAMARDSVAGG